MIVETLIKKLNEMPKDLQVVMPDMIPITKAVKSDYGSGVVIITDTEEMTVEEFKDGLEKFFGTENYHQLTTFPVYATDGVEYFCRNILFIIGLLILVSLLLLLSNNSATLLLSVLLFTITSFTASLISAVPFILLRFDDTDTVPCTDPTDEPLLSAFGTLGEDLAATAAPLSALARRTAACINASSRFILF